MGYGVMVTETREGLDGLVASAADMAARGFDAVWLAQVFGVDALTALAVIAREVPTIELGTAVVPTYPRHPAVLAGQALTVQAASGGRLALGIGLSHQIVIEGAFGYSFAKPARHMREYLSVLLPLLRGENVAFEGDTVTWRGMGPISLAAPAPQVLLAALAPRMLALAGGEADGTVTWMTGAATVRDHITPSIAAAAEAAGRQPPRIAVGLPVCVTDDLDAARARAAQTFAMYGMLPSYRAMLDREGAEGPGDVAIVGDDASVEKQVLALFDAGATDFIAAPFGGRDERSRTLDVIQGLAAR